MDGAHISKQAGRRKARLPSRYRFPWLLALTDAVGSMAWPKALERDMRRPCLVLCAQL